MYLISQCPLKLTQLQMDIFEVAQRDPIVASTCKEWAVDRLQDPLGFTLDEFELAQLIKTQSWFKGS